jgi:hypothetical protein
MTGLPAEPPQVFATGELNTALSALVVPLVLPGGVLLTQLVTVDHKASTPEPPFQILLAARAE